MEIPKETKNHKQLKRAAWNLLLKNGFKSYEIKFEQKIIINDKKVFVDVLGSNNKYGYLIVECGDLKQDKIDLFERNGINYIHLPYENITRISMEVDTDLHTKFRKYCIDHHTTMKIMLTRLISRVIKNNRR